MMMINMMMMIMMMIMMIMVTIVVMINNIYISVSMMVIMSRVIEPKGLNELEQKTFSPFGNLGK